MKIVLVTGAGGAAGIGVTRSLKQAGYRVIGVDCNPYKAQLAETEKCYLAPKSSENAYGFVQRLNEIIKVENVNFVHAQPWLDVLTVSKCRKRIKAKTFLPSKISVSICTNKWDSYLLWHRHGLKVPETRKIDSFDDIVKLCARYGKIWIRPKSGAGGNGALLTDDPDMAGAWINLNKSVKDFTVAEYLSPRSTTWMSLWRNGELIVAQGRERLYWEFGSKFLSGVSGITGACKTISDPQVDKIALKAIKAIDEKPNGIWSVDLTYSKDGVPCPTEVNIGKFFTTVEFFTQAGVNFPDLYARLAFGEKVEPLGVNPLPPDLVWIRGVDSKPVLTSMEKIKKVSV